MRCNKTASVPYSRCSPRLWFWGGRHAQAGARNHTSAITSSQKPPDSCQRCSCLGDASGHWECPARPQVSDASFLPGGCEDRGAAVSVPVRWGARNTAWINLLHLTQIWMLCPTDRKVGRLRLSESPPGFPASGVWSQSQVSWSCRNLGKAQAERVPWAQPAVSPGAVSCPSSSLCNPLLENQLGQGSQL